MTTNQEPERRYQLKRRSSLAGGTPSTGANAGRVARRSGRPSDQGNGPAAVEAGAKPAWTFLTNHAHVLTCIIDEPDVRGRDIAARVRITERAAQAIIADLVAAGYVRRRRQGRRNHYSVDPAGPMRHPLDHGHTVGDLFAALGRLPGAGRGSAPDEGSGSG